MRHHRGGPAPAVRRVTIPHRAIDTEWYAWQARVAKRLAALDREPGEQGPCYQGLRAMVEQGDVSALVMHQYATYSPVSEDSLPAFRLAVQLGEQELAGAYLLAHRGHLSRRREAHGYLTARAALARRLVLMGQREEAISHYVEIMGFDEGDPNATRRPLLGLYLAERRLDDAQRLWADYRADGSATYRWGRVLLCWHQRRLEAAEAALALARAANQCAEDFVTGRRQLDARLVARLAEPGTVDDAQCMYMSLEQAWHIAPGAVKWIGQQPAREPRADDAATCGAIEGIRGIGDHVLSALPAERVDRLREVVASYEQWSRFLPCDADPAYDVLESMAMDSVDFMRGEAGHLAAAVVWAVRDHQALVDPDTGQQVDLAGFAHRVGTKPTALSRRATPIRERWTLGLLGQLASAASAGPLPPPLDRKD